jgi:THH1/TOM1/TOM3 domain
MMDSEIEILAIVSLILYLLLLYIGTVVFIKWIGSERHFFRPLSIERIFFAFTFCFLVTRCFWVVTRVYDDDGLAELILNRLAFVTFFTAFTSLLFFWVERIHSSQLEEHASGGRQIRLPRVAWLFFVTNLIVWIFQIVMIVLIAVLDDSSREGNVSYEVNSDVIILLSLLVALGFLIYGAALYRRVRRSSLAVDDTRRTRSRLRRILLLCVTLTACFLLRALTFLWRPMTRNYMNANAFIVLAYLAPELLAVSLGFWILHRTSRDDREASSFIKSLYSGGGGGTLTTRVDSGDDLAYGDIGVAVAAAHSSTFFYDGSSGSDLEGRDDDDERGNSVDYDDESDDDERRLRERARRHGSLVHAAGDGDGDDNFVTEEERLLTDDNTHIASTLGGFQQDPRSRGMFYNSATPPKKSSSRSSASSLLNPPPSFPSQSGGGSLLQDLCVELDE